MYIQRTSDITERESDQYHNVVRWCVHVQCHVQCTYTMCYIHVYVYMYMCTCTCTSTTSTTCTHTCKMYYIPVHVLVVIYNNYNSVSILLFVRSHKRKILHLDIGIVSHHFKSGISLCFFIQ